MPVLKWMRNTEISEYPGELFSKELRIKNEKDGFDKL
jgi:hypothetical protein